MCCWRKPWWLMGSKGIWYSIVRYLRGLQDGSTSLLCLYDAGFSKVSFKCMSCGGGLGRWPVRMRSQEQKKELRVTEIAWNSFCWILMSSSTMIDTTACVVASINWATMADRCLTMANCCNIPVTENISNKKILRLIIDSGSSYMTHSRPNSLFIWPNWAALNYP